MEGPAGVEPALGKLKACCSTVKPQTLNKQKRACRPCTIRKLYEYTRVYCLALPPRIVCIAIEAVVTVVAVRVDILVAISLLYTVVQKAQVLFPFYLVCRRNSFYFILIACRLSYHRCELSALWYPLYLTNTYSSMGWHLLVHLLPL